MVAHGVYSRLSAELKEIESRLGARLDLLEFKLNVLVEAGGHAAPPRGGDQRPRRVPADAAKDQGPALNETK